MSAEEFALRTLDVVARSDLHGELWWRTDGGYAPATFWIKCSDVFAWGTADAEPVTADYLPAFEQALREVREVTGNNSWGAELYCARRRGRRPQGDAYPDDRRLWPSFDACGPEREIGLGNPYLPGRVKPKTAEYDELRRHITAVHHNLAGRELSDSVRRVAVLTDGAARLVALFGLLDWPDVLDVLEQTYAACRPSACG